MSQLGFQGAAGSSLSQEPLTDLRHSSPRSPPQTLSNELDELDAFDALDPGELRRDPSAAPQIGRTSTMLSRNILSRLKAQDPVKKGKLKKFISQGKFKVIAHSTTFVKDKHVNTIFVGKLILNPDHWVYTVWYAWTLLVIFIFVWLVPIRLAFDARTAETGRFTPLLSLETFIDAVFFLDIMITFRLAFREYGKLVKEPKAIFKNYFKFRFWIDFVGCFPFGLLFESSTTDRTSKMVFELLGLLRFLRIGRLVQFMHRCENNFKLNYSVLAIGKFVSILLAVGHMSGCGMYLTARYNEFVPGTWIADKAPHLPNATLSEQYVTSVYWSFTTLTTVGYGDFSPVHISERIVCMIVMIINVGLSAYILGNMTLLATKQDAKTAMYRARMQDLHHYMKSHHIPEELCQQAQTHLQLAANMSKDQHAVMQHVPPFIRLQIQRHLFRDTIMGQELFQGAMEMFLDQLVSEVTVENFFEDDYIFSVGDNPNAFYIVLEGSVHLIQKGSRKKLAKGETFGVDSVMCDVPQIYTARGASPLLRVLEIKQQLWKSLALRFPREVRRMSVLRLREMEGRFKKFPDNKILAQRVKQLRRWIARNKQLMAVAMCDAARQGDNDEMRHLLDRGGLQPDQTDSDKRTALHHGANQGHLQAVQLLLDSNASTSLKDRFGTTPLLDAIKQRHFDVADVLVNAGAKLRLPHPGSFLCQLTFAGDVVELGALLKYRADPNCTNFDARTPLHVASIEGNGPCVRILLKYKADIDAKDRWERTPLDDSVAASHQHVTALLNDFKNMKGSPVKEKRGSVSSNSDFSR